MLTTTHLNNQEQSFKRRSQQRI